MGKECVEIQLDYHDYVHWMGQERLCVREQGNYFVDQERFISMMVDYSAKMYPYRYPEFYLQGKRA